MDPIASRSFDWVCVASNLVDDYVGGWMNFARSMCLDLSVGIFKAAAKRQCADEEAFPPLSSAKNTSAKKSSTKKSSAKRSSWQLGILQYPWSSVFLLPDFFGSIDLSSYFCTCNRKLSLISYSFCALEFYNSLETDRKYLQST